MARDAFQAAKLEWLLRVAQDPVLDAGATRLAVLLALKYVDRQKLCAWPAVARMATDLSVGQNAIRRAIRGLENRGLLLVERGGGRQSNDENASGIRGASSHYFPLLDGETLPRTAGLSGRQTLPPAEGLNRSYTSTTGKGKTPSENPANPSVCDRLTLPPVEGDSFYGILTPELERKKRKTDGQKVPT